MALLEFIILTIIYGVFYGYTLAMFIKEKNVWLKILFAIVFLALVFSQIALLVTKCVN